MELGLISNSALNPSVYWTTLLPPLFSRLADQPGVRTIAPPPLAWERLSEWREVRSQVKGCDALFWIQLAARPIGSIHLASYLNLGARRSNFILDAWKPSLTKIGLVATIERLDPCFVAYREAMDELTRRFPLAKFVWLPFGAHTDVFYPRKEEKSIFAFWLGRRYEPLHQALLAYCEARDLRYVYSQGGGLTTEEVGRLTSSAQYYVATPPDLDQPKRTGGFSPLVMRYFEGLAAGTRLLGVLPRSGEYESILPTDAFCQVSPDGSDLANRLDEDRSNLSNQRMVDAAGAFVREHHSWRRRAEQVFDHLATGAAIEFPIMQKERPVGLVVSRPGVRQDLAHDLKTTERFG
jgi:Glycosyl transferases group 1